MASNDAIFRVKAPVFMQQLILSFSVTDFQAAGVFGNIGHECAGFTQLHELGQPPGSGGYGWAQWTGQRHQAFFHWCAEQQLQWQEDEANYGFLEFELRTDFSGALAALKATSDLAGAVKSFEQKYEMAGVPNIPSRMRWAQIALDSFNAFNAQA